MLRLGIAFPHGGYMDASQLLESVSPAYGTGHSSRVLPVRVWQAIARRPVNWFAPSMFRADDGLDAQRDEVRGLPVGGLYGPCWKPVRFQTNYQRRRYAWLSKERQRAWRRMFFGERITPME